MLTGYTAEELLKKIASNDSVGSSFSNAPELNPKRKLIKGAICEVRVEEIDQPLMQEVRYLDKLVDELAKGKKCRLSLGTDDRRHTKLSRTTMVTLHMKSLSIEALQKKIELLEILVLGCRNHPVYRAVRRVKLDCATCKRMWYARQKLNEFKD